MSQGKYLIGGLLAGLGDGLVKTGTAKRAAMLEELERNHAEMMQQKQFSHADETLTKTQTFTADQNRLDRENEIKDNGLLDADRFTAGGKLWLQSPDGSVKPALGPDGKQLIDPKTSTSDTELVEVADPNSPSGTTWMPKSQAVGKPGKSGASSAEDIAAQKETDARNAEDRATEIVDGMAEFLTSDKTQFGPGGRAAAVEKVARALIAGQSEVVINGKAVDLGGSDSNLGADDEDVTPEQEPNGGKPKGTQSDPYKPMTAADMAAIPSGAIYINPSDNKPYRKK